MNRSMMLALMIVALFAFEADGQAVATQAVQDGKAKAKAEATPVALADGTATLSPENTKVEFVGIHVPDEPKPRLGGFTKFTGSLAVNEDGSLKSVNLDFETASVWTQLGGDLTAHLKKPDFLDVEKYPAAKFVSKSVKAGKEGMVDVVGDFTLMDKTNEITLPVKFTKTDEGVVLSSEFTLDRVTFGMDKMTNRVSKDVNVTLSVGEKTSGQAAETQTAGEGRGQNRGGGRAGTMFKNSDKDGDGKLTGDEIPQFLKERVDTLDTDKDGSLSMEEIQKGMAGRGGRGQRDR